MGFLEKIVAAKQEEVARLRQAAPLGELQARVKGRPAGLNFKRAITSGACSIIAEVKKHSPSKGSLREDLDPVAVASLYERNGAAAISVLTDREFFHGSPEFLIDIKKKVRIPVLRKDFIIDPYQIYESKLLGADAILLIAGLLSEKRLREYMEIARSLGVCPLVEAHAKADLEVALSAGAEIIGINNRDLQTFATDINTTLQLAPGIPPDKTIICESAIRTREDITLLMEEGIKAFLVGEALISAADPGRKLRELLGEDHC